MLERLGPVILSELGHVLPALTAEGGGDESPLHERYRSHRAMRELLEQLAATKPLLLILDDVHWADGASVDLLAALLLRPPSAGVLVVIGARPRQLPTRLASALDRLERDGHLDRLELEALTRDDARELVGARRRCDLRRERRQPLLPRAARCGSPPRRPPRGDDVMLAGVKVPPQVAAALAEELALLPQAARRVLEGAAVAGDPFELDLAALAADMPEAPVFDALDELVGVRPGPQHGLAPALPVPSSDRPPRRLRGRPQRLAHRRPRARGGGPCRPAGRHPSGARTPHRALRAAR